MTIEEVRKERLSVREVDNEESSRKQITYLFCLSPAVGRPLGGGTDGGCLRLMG
jgi:hypothetical protein